MQVSNKNIKLQAVFNRDKKQIVAIIKTAIVSLDKGQCLGLLCVGGQVIAFNDLNWDSEARVFYVQNDSQVCSQIEVIRVDSAIKNKEYLRKQKVITKNGAKIGRLLDFIFDPQLGSLISLVVKRRVWLSTYSLLVHRNNILNAGPKIITVRNSQAFITNPETKKAAPLRTALSDTKSATSL